LWAETATLELKTDEIRREDVHIKIGPRVLLTTDTRASSYGYPALCIDGNAYGPADDVMPSLPAEDWTRILQWAPGYIARRLPATHVVVDWARLAPRSEQDYIAADLYLRQWPTGPQIDEQMQVIAQRRDTTQASDQTPEVSRDRVYATRDGKPFLPIRIKSEGFGVTDDSTSKPIEDLLRDRGAKLRHIADARGRGFVGSITGGPIQEYSYDLDGQHWYMYVLTSSTGDDWCQEWWVSHQRLSASAAGKAIEASRMFF
jgi:hypothetical protein